MEVQSFQWKLASKCFQKKIKYFNYENFHEKSIVILEKREENFQKNKKLFLDDKTWTHSTKNIIDNPAFIMEKQVENFQKNKIFLWTKNWKYFTKKCVENPALIMGKWVKSFRKKKKQIWMGKTLKEVCMESMEIIQKKFRTFCWKRNIIFHIRKCPVFLMNIHA